MSSWPKNLVVTACLGLLVAGCGGTPESASSPAADTAVLGTLVPVTWTAPAGTKKPVPGIDHGTAYALGTTFVLWADRVGGITVTSTSDAKGVQCHGSLIGPGGRPVEFRCESRDRKTGQVAIDGTNYELAKGGFFAVFTRSDPVRVEQLKRDLTTLKFDKDALAAFAREDADLAAFFGERVKKK
jgi:hypothetical protein